jgi:tetratricopeptide (TPR) repeat protein
MLILGFTGLYGTVVAQSVESRYGVDSVQTIQNASIYTEFVKQKNYTDALPAWRYVFTNAPAFQLLTYTRGEEIMTDLLQKTQNPAYLDTLMMVYDQWIKYFGDHQTLGKGFALGKKGYNLYRFKGGENIEAAKEAYRHLSDSYDHLRYKAAPPVVMATMVAADRLLKEGIITKDEYIGLYIKFSDYVEKNPLKATRPEPLAEVKSQIDALFFNAGVADCEALVNFMTQKFESSGDDMEVLKEIARVLRRGECTDAPLYAQVAERLYQSEPTAESAYNLAMLFLRRQEFDKTEGYLKEAIEKSTDDEAKVDYYLRMAQIKNGKQQYQEARRFALEALKINPDAGEAYILIGNAYAAYSKNYGSDDFDHKMVFWVAVDKFQKAKQVDPSVSEKANQLINTYSPHFPSKDEAFFRDIHAGSAVKVGDWINETTTARFRE